MIKAIKFEYEQGKGIFLAVVYYLSIKRIVQDVKKKSCTRIKYTV